jgi:peptidoglycan hydrolase CwlO-like protein
MPRRTSLHLITPALLVLAFGLAVGPAAAAVQGIAAPVAQSTPKQSDLKKAEQQVAAAQKRLDTAERALEQAADLRKSIRDRIEQGQEEVKLTTAQQAVLQRELGARARSAYMRGAPSNISSLLTSHNSEDLLDRAEMLDRIADHGNTTISDLQQLQKAIDGSRAKLLELEKQAAGVEKTLKARLAEADKAFEDADRIRRAIVRKLGEAERKRLAQQTSTSRISGVRNSGGLCDLSGVPAAARTIIMRESGGSPTADNPTSTAFGLGQLLLSNRQRLIPENPNTTDCGLQYRAFKQYVTERYGTFDAALAFHNAHGYY